MCVLFFFCSTKAKMILMNLSGIMFMCEFKRNIESRSHAQGKIFKFSIQKSLKNNGQ